MPPPLRADLSPAAEQRHLDRDAWEITNGQTNDWADDDNLSVMIAAYEADGLPFTVQQFPARSTDHGSYCDG